MICRQNDNYYQSNAEKDDTIVTSPEIPTGAADITDLFVSAIKQK